jgi:hypothetical protein
LKAEINSGRNTGREHKPITGTGGAMIDKPSSQGQKIENNSASYTHYNGANKSSLTGNGDKVTLTAFHYDPQHLEHELGVSCNCFSDQIHTTAASYPSTLNYATNWTTNGGDPSRHQFDVTNSSYYGKFSVGKQSNIGTALYEHPIVHQTSSSMAIERSNYHEPSGLKSVARQSDHSSSTRKQASTNHISRGNFPPRVADNITRGSEGMSTEMTNTTDQSTTSALHHSLSFSSSQSASSIYSEGGNSQVQIAGRHYQQQQHHNQSDNTVVYNQKRQDARTANCLTLIGDDCLNTNALPITGREREVGGNSIVANQQNHSHAYHGKGSMGQTERMGGEYGGLIPIGEEGSFDSSQQKQQQQRRLALVESNFLARSVVQQQNSPLLMGVFDVESSAGPPRAAANWSHSNKAVASTTATNLHANRSFDYIGSAAGIVSNSLPVHSHYNSNQHLSSSIASTHQQQNAASQVQQQKQASMKHVLNDAGVNDPFALASAANDGAPPTFNLPPSSTTQQYRNSVDGSDYILPQTSQNMPLGQASSASYEGQHQYHQIEARTNYAPSQPSANAPPIIY